MYWFREIAGWALIVLGLWIFYVSYFVLLKNNYIVETGPTVLMGVITFRGGIHLLKVAVAARICREAPREANSPAPRPGASRPTNRPSVVPGR